MEHCCEINCCCHCDSDEEEDLPYYNDGNPLCEDLDVSEMGSVSVNNSNEIKVPEDDNRVINLPLKFHLLQFEFTLEGRQFSLGSSCEDFVSITKEINAIWAVANIKFTSSCINHGLLEEVEEENNLIESIEQAEPDGSIMGSKGARKRSIERLVNGRFPPLVGFINIYILPSIGRGIEGISFTHFDRDFEGVSVISEHESSGQWKRLPKIASSKKQQSLAKVIAHELGHLFNLIHYDCNGCLMASQKEVRGYELQDNHIQRARRYAKRIEDIIRGRR